MRDSTFQKLSELTCQRLTGRFTEAEVRNSILQIAARWKHVMSEDEKRKVSRTLGGNRYAKSTRAVLDVLFEDIVEEWSE